MSQTDQLQGDEIPLVGDVLPFILMFLVGALVMYLGAVVSVMHDAASLQEVKSKVARMSFWANYTTVLIMVVMPAAYVVSLGIVQHGMAVLIPSAASFFSTGLSLEQRAKQAIAQARRNSDGSHT